MKNGVFFFTILLVLVCKVTFAEFSCPPFEKKKSCLESAAKSFEDCKSEMAEVLRDPDSLTIRSHAYYMLNYGCQMSFDVSIRSCLRTCIDD